MQLARDLLVMQAENGFDQTGDACRRFQVADVSLHCTQPARLRVNASFI